MGQKLKPGEGVGVELINTALAHRPKALWKCQLHGLRQTNVQQTPEQLCCLQTDGCDLWHLVVSGWQDVLGSILKAQRDSFIHSHLVVNSCSCSRGEKRRGVVGGEGLADTQLQRQRAQTAQNWEDREDG